MPWVFHLGGEAESEPNDEHAVEDREGHGEPEDCDDGHDTDDERAEPMHDDVSALTLALFG